MRRRGVYRAFSTWLSSSNFSTPVLAALALQARPAAAVENISPHNRDRGAAAASPVPVPAVLIPCMPPSVEGVVSAR